MDMDAGSSRASIKEEKREDLEKFLCHKLNLDSEGDAPNNTTFLRRKGG